MAQAEGDLIETDKPVDPDLEVTGLQKHLDGGCPVLFNNVKGKPNHRVLTNLFGDINVINKMFGWKDDVERTRKLAYALSHPLKPVEIPQSVAPCQEHVIKNPKDVNEHMVAIRHTTYEPELTVGSGIRCVTGAVVRWRLRPRLQPHELPLGQCRHLPDLARLAHVAGGQQALQGERAGADHHVLRRAAGLHAARRRRLRLCHPADGLRRDRHRRRRAGLADPAGQGAHRRRHGDRRLRAGAGRLCQSARPPLRDQGVRGRRRSGPLPFPSGMGGLHGQGLQGADLPRHRGDHAQAARRSRSSSRSACTRSTITTSTPRCARSAIYRAVQPAAARHHPGRGDPLLDDRLGRLPSSRSRSATRSTRAGSATSSPPSCRARRACGSPSR